MEWIWDAANSVAIVATLIWAGVGFRHLAEENDQRKANIRRAEGRANEASATALEAKRTARKALDAVGPKEVIVPSLPDTPHNRTLVEKLRGAAHRAELKRQEASREAHPAGTRRVPGMRRSAVTGRYVTHKNPTTQAALNNPSYDFLPVAAVIAATDFGSSHTSSYSDSSSSSSSSSSSDSGGSFSGGDSGSF